MGDEQMQVPLKGNSKTESTTAPLGPCEKMFVGRLILCFDCSQNTLQDFGGQGGSIGPE